MLQPKFHSKKLKKLCIGSIYISPTSKYKKDTINHIIEAIHIVRSKYDNVSYLISGDFNEYCHQDILDSYGALNQVVRESTRKDRVLEIILTDLHTDYHTPVSLPPLQADVPGKGQDSDHNVVLFPPIAGPRDVVKHEYKVITVRPLPLNQII